jgi:hypothetical protein
MSDCVSVEAWMDPSDDERRHVASCPQCQGLVQDVQTLRELARRLPESGWAGESAPVVDVEAALASVLSCSDRLSVRRQRAPRVLQFASSLAAAAVLLSTAAPSLLRLRIDAQPTAQAPQQLSGVTPNSIFWTTASGR